MSSDMQRGVQGNHELRLQRPLCLEIITEGSQFLSNWIEDFSENTVFLRKGYSPADDV